MEGDVKVGIGGDDAVAVTVGNFGNGLSRRRGVYELM